MLSLEYKTLCALHHVSLILCQISEHLKDALLTKSLDQFIEARKNQNTFSKTQKCDLRLIALFSYSTLQNWELTSPFKAFIWKTNVG